MAAVVPLTLLRPPPSMAEAVAAVPYDVVTRAEAAALAQGCPESFLHVTRPEIDLDPHLQATDPTVYAQGGTALHAMLARGTLVRERAPAFFVYGLTWGHRTQTGVVLGASALDYERNEVRRHEHTRPDKETDRVHHMEAVNAQTGVVFLVHRPHRPLQATVASVIASPPEVDFLAADQVRHRVWPVYDPAVQHALVTGFGGAGPLYIADGHHRSAAAARVAAARRVAARPGTHEHFVAVAFPTDEVQILPYHRVVRDLGSWSVDAFRKELAARFVVRDGTPTALGPREFGMFLDGRWSVVQVPPGSYDPNDPVARLDVSLLQDQLLGPVLGIHDPRHDPRLGFVGGVGGLGTLEAKVPGGAQSAQVAFALRATAIDDLLAIADAGAVMPPKSTWFEPKLRDGLFVHPLG